MRLTKRILCTAVILLNVAAFIGCGGTKTVEGREKETAAPESTAAQDDVHFMMSAYGLSREELQGIDVEQLISDYELREREYTPEEIRMILADQGDMYAEDETTVLFRILSKEGGPLKNGQADIVRIGFYENAGTLVERSVFDLKNRVFYVDGPEPHPMSEAQAEELYRGMSCLASNFENWQMGFITSNKNFQKCFGKYANLLKNIKSGNLNTCFYMYTDQGEKGKK